MHNTNSTMTMANNCRSFLFFFGDFAHSTSNDTPKTPTTTRTHNKASNGNTEFVPVINKLHTIYPAIGKRSAHHSQHTGADKFYMDHHRSTRHGLYHILEKYLSAYVFIGYHFRCGWLPNTLFGFYSSRAPAPLWARGVGDVDIISWQVRVSSFSHSFLGLCVPVGEFV